MIKGILFDFDGVLVDSEPLHCKSFQETLAPLGIKFDEKRWYNEFAGTGSRTILKKLFEEYKLKEDLDFWLKKRKEGFLKYAKQGELRITNGLIEFLDQIKEKQIKTTVSSSGNLDYILVLLKQLRLTKYFNEIISAEDIKNNKPNPEIFLLSAKKLDLSSSECLVVEDSVSGVAAGKAAKMKVVCISSPASVVCEIKIKDFTEFPMYLLS